MGNDRQHGIDVDPNLHHDFPARLPTAPGRATLTSRHVMRKERDANGVAPDADALVERAASSSGTALPSELRERFESSLGTDLSGVRLHTGGASGTAASAVGAKAYTVGQDIHFGAGHYDPSSSSGQFLIAHEVAHTVQQAGSTPSRQNKLEVSSPHDTAETEADAVAAAMVAGESATVTSRPVLAARQPAGKSKHGECVPRNWGSEVAGGGTVATGYWDEGPDFSAFDDGEYDWGGYQDGRDTFAQDWAAAQSAYNQVGPLCDDYDAASLQAEEQGLTGPATDKRAEGTLKDPGAKDKPVDLETTVSRGSIGGTTSGITMGESVQADTLAGARSKVKTSEGQLDDDVNAVLHTAEIDLQKALRGVEDSGTEYRKAVRAVSTAVTKLSIAKAEKEGADAETQKVQLEREKAIVLAGIDAVANAMKIGSAYAGMKGDMASAAKDGASVGYAGAAGGGGVVEAVQGYATFWVSQEFDTEIHSIQMKLQSVASSIASWNIAIEENGVQDAIDDVNTKANAVKAARTAVVEAEQKRREKLKTLAEKAKKNAAGNNATEREQDAIYSAIRGLPLVEGLVSRTGDIVTKAAVPAYSDRSGIGAWFCANTDVFVYYVGNLKTTHDEFTQTRNHWQGVEKRIKAMIAGMHSSAAE